MRSLLLGCLALLANSLAPAAGEEPLYLRIQPKDARSPDGGGASILDDAIAARARAAREAVWQRAERRAHLAIASVCKGCLKEGASEADRPASPSSKARTADTPDDTEAAASAGAAPLSLADSR